jgi:glucose-1-phosphate thymidylyltransferase
MKINIVIPAAGEATRLRPLTNNCSKSMVRIHGKPALSYILDSIQKTSEINQVIVVDGKHDDIREWLDSNKHPYDIKCVKQGSLDGPRDAINVGIQELSNPKLPLVVWLGDAIILDDNLQLGYDFLLTKKVDDHFSWCMYDGEKFYNKPKEHIPNATALVGLYSFSDGISVKKSFSSTNDYDISAALELYIKEVNSNFGIIEAKKWYDIGDISSYHKTCAEFLTFKTRDFNSFEYDPNLNVLTKVPNSNNKFAATTILNEKNWYNKLNSKQQMFVPKILENDYGLSLSYESGILLSDLLAHENISNATIDYLIEKVISTMRIYFHQRASLDFAIDFNDNAKAMWVDKSEERLNHYDCKSIDEYSRAFYRATARNCYAIAEPIQAMHGDLHFGNIIYNPYNDSITLLDPRGQYGNHKGCGGDYVYDLCKLSHDLYHGYNGIVSGYEYPEYVKESFLKIINNYYNKEEVRYIIDGGALLIATCIPLHYDDPKRQKRMINYVTKYANNSN